MTDILERARAACVALNDQELVDAGIHRRGEHFKPVICYPAMDQLPFADVSDLLGEAPALADPAAVYVHIPFCRARCIYCHWVIRLRHDDDEVTRYLDCVEHELRSYCERLGVERIGTSSVLVGGGTPSLLPPRALERFLGLCDRYLDLEPCVQYSFEAEPGSLLGEDGQAWLRLLKDFGVHRISMGVQSFDDDLLRRSARTHTTAEALDAVAAIRGAGIPSISLDLIYGLPGETVENWVRTMQTALSSGADAWQLYRLRVVPHGDSPGMVERHHEKHPDLYNDVDDMLMMKMAAAMMSEESGYHQHYTRIFARGPEHISMYLHDVNIALRDMIGVGISAWGNVGNAYLLNVGDDFGKYYDMVARGELPVDRGLARDAETEARHSLILPLKNDHVDLASFRARTGSTPHALCGETLDRLAGLALIEEDAETLTLTDRGRFYADQVVTQLAQEQYRPMTRPTLEIAAKSDGDSAPPRAAR